MSQMTISSMLNKEQEKIITKFPSLQVKETQFNRAFAYSFLPKLKGFNILDIGCGDGSDISYFENMGATCVGLEIDHKKVLRAKNVVKKSELIEITFDNLPFEDNRFDLVWSKYSLTQTCNLEKVISDVYRVLKTGGVFLLLSVHPFRQLIHKNSERKYFERNEIIIDDIPGVDITIKEYQYKFEDYIKTLIKSGFKIEEFEEVQDPSSESSQEFKDKPDFFLIKASK